MGRIGRFLLAISLVTFGGAALSQVGQTKFATQAPPTLIVAGKQTFSHQYAAPWGNDANDGQSWGSAKATWDAACEGLYGGGISANVHYCGQGTIHIQNGIWANANHAVGIQLMGNGGDPNYPYAAAGWEMLQLNIKTVCDSGQSSASNGANVCQIQGGGAADIWHPGLWITAADKSTEWDGVAFLFQGRNVVLGVCSDRSQPMSGACGVSSTIFHGVNTELGNATATNGPGWCIGSNTLWLQVDNYSIGGNPYNAAGGPSADNAAAVLLGSCNPATPNPSATNNGVGAVNFYNGILKGGGFKLWSGNAPDGTFTVQNATSENATEAMVWLRGPFSGQYNISGLTAPFDCDGGDCFTIKNDSPAPVPAVSSYGTFSGQIEMLSPYPLGNPTVTPTTSNLYGFISPYKFRAQSDAAAREFPVVAAIGTPLISSTITSGTVTPCGTCTLTTGKTDPSGGTNAVQISDTNASGDESFMLASGDGGAVVGDTYFISIWMKPITGNCCASGGVFVFHLGGVAGGGDTCSVTGTNNFALAPYSNAPSWQHYVGTCKITAYASASPPILSLTSSLAATMQYSFPQLFLLHGYTDDEVAEIALNLGTWSSACSAGQACSVTGPIGGGVIASGTAALGTSAIASGACATTVTVSAPGAVAGNVVGAAPNADISGIVGYIPSTSGTLTIYPPWATTGNVNFKVCNFTSSSITPGATVTLNWNVTP